MTRLYLHALGDYHVQEIYVDRYPFIIGRHPDCDAQILHPLMSRHHCRFFLKDGQPWIQDLESLNGTTLNGESIQLPRSLKRGDRISFPFYDFRVEMEITSDHPELADSGTN